MESNEFASGQENRSALTRNKLESAARALFIEKGFVATGTPEIVKAAGVTRGALYHHYADKVDLFRAVMLSDCQAVTDAIEAQAALGQGAADALKEGSKAFMTAITEHGRTEIILIEALVALGRKDARDIQEQTTRRSLEEGLEMVLAAGLIPTLPLAPLVDILSAMFDEAALRVHEGEQAQSVCQVLDSLIDGLFKA